ncbi:MAG: hypothetical protein HUK14_11055 [Muribaculaceae bacterium]|nr:hypothetical protein [Muribaculaceae bacterium]
MLLLADALTYRDAVSEPRSTKTDKSHCLAGWYVVNWFYVNYLLLFLSRDYVLAYAGKTAWRGEVI